MDDRPKWWQLPWREIICTLVGAFMLLWQTVLDANKSPLIVGAGLALLGVSGTGLIQRATKRVTGGE